MATETDWLRSYAEAMRYAQRFEEALLSLLLTVRDYRGDAEVAARDFRALLAEDHRSPAGTVLQRLFEDRALMEKVVANGFGPGWTGDDVKQEVQLAVSARNNLAHYYFRSHTFSETTTGSLLRELEGLQLLLVIATKVCQALQWTMTPERTPDANPQVFSVRVMHLLDKHKELQSLALQGFEKRKELSVAATRIEVANRD
jgi:hypothetical protein